MDTTGATSATQPEPQTEPGSLAHWLAGHAGLADETLAGLVALIEPLGNQASIKSVGNGRYVFATAGLAQIDARAADRPQLGAVLERKGRGDPVEPQGADPGRNQASHRAAARAGRGSRSR